MAIKYFADPFAYSTAHVHHLSGVLHVSWKLLASNNHLYMVHNTFVTGSAKGGLIGFTITCTYLIIHKLTCEYGTNITFGHYTLLT